MAFRRIPRVASANKVGLGDARRKYFKIKQQLANGIDANQAVINGRTFESVALDWHASMARKWVPGHAKTVLSRWKTHVFPLIGARAMVGLDTHDFMQPLEAVTKRGTLDVAVRIKNYLHSIMQEAKRLRLITANPAYDLDGSIKTPTGNSRPALPLSRLPELLAYIGDYRGRPGEWVDLKRGIWEILDTRPALDGVPFNTRNTKMAGDILVK